MATKKQRRAAAEAKHEKFMAELKRSNAEVLQQVRERREQKHRESWQEQHDKDHDWRHRNTNCPWCQDAINEGKRQAWLLMRAAKNEKAG